MVLRVLWVPYIVLDSEIPGVKQEAKDAYSRGVTFKTLDPASLSVSTLPYFPFLHSLHPMIHYLNHSVLKILTSLFIILPSSTGRSPA